MNYTTEYLCKFSLPYRSCKIAFVDRAFATLRRVIQVEKMIQVLIVRVHCCARFYSDEEGGFVIVQPFQPRQVHLNMPGVIIYASIVCMRAECRPLVRTECGLL